MLPLLVSISTRGLAGWPAAGAVETVCLPDSLAPQPEMPSMIAPRNSVTENREGRVIGKAPEREAGILAARGGIRHPAAGRGRWPLAPLPAAGSRCRPGA